jgi:hypothetical protein
VSRERISASPEKVEAVTKFSVPKNVKEVRSFLGLASFYRQLIPKFAEIAKPLTELIRKNSHFKWEAQQDTAFTRLKVALTTEPVLAYLHFSSVFSDHRLVKSRGSRNYIVSAGRHGKTRLFATRQLKQAKQNYSASELELLAIAWATFPMLFVRKTFHSSE